jgi:hypothetical protein
MNNDIKWLLFCKEIVVEKAFPKKEDLMWDSNSRLQLFAFKLLFLRKILVEKLSNEIPEIYESYWSNSYGFSLTSDNIANELSCACNGITITDVVRFKNVDFALISMSAAKVIRCRWTQFEASWSIEDIQQIWDEEQKIRMYSFTKETEEGENFLEEFYLPFICQDGKTDPLYFEMLFNHKFVNKLSDIQILGVTSIEDYAKHRDKNLSSVTVYDFDIFEDFESNSMMMLMNSEPENIELSASSDFIAALGILQNLFSASILNRINSIEVWFQRLETITEFLSSCKEQLEEEYGIQVTPNVYRIKVDPSQNLSLEEAHVILNAKNVDFSGCSSEWFSEFINSYWWKKSSKRVFQAVSLTLPSLSISQISSILGFAPKAETVILPLNDIRLLALKNLNNRVDQIILKKTKNDFVIVKRGEIWADQLGLIKINEK